MDKLIQYQTNLLNSTDNHFTRFAYETLPWDKRFLGIKGFRGVGKTTLLLQYLKYHLQDNTKHLYVTLDHPYFYQNSLYELAEKFHQLGGRTLLVDEVHKLPEWSKQIKIIYDAFPRLQLIFTSSSAIDIIKGEADLSRRVLLYQLPGLSLREYLALHHQIYFDKLSIPDILENHVTIAQQISQKIRPIAVFEKYLKIGYYPYSYTETMLTYQQRLIQSLAVVLQVDLANINGYTSENTYKIKKLLGIIAQSPPFTINVSAIAEKLGIGRNTVKEYLHALEKAEVISFLNRSGKGISTLQKPDKIFLQNTNLAFVLQQNVDVGTLRETFALSQLNNANIENSLPASGDIYLNQTGVTFEIGGKSKTRKQIVELPNGYVLSDNIEIGFGKKVPLYLLGFLY